MPEWLVQKIMKALNRGVIPKICKERKLKGRKCAELIVAIIENRRKKLSTMKGGEGEGVGKPT